jgi:hypothetical protein
VGERYLKTEIQTANAASKARRAKAPNAGLIEIQIEYRNLTDIVLDLRNPRQHSQLQINQIADGIWEFSFCAQVMIDHAGQNVIGHARFLAAKKLAMHRMAVVRWQILTGHDAIRSDGKLLRGIEAAKEVADER